MKAALFNNEGISFRSLKDSIRQSIWVSNEPENLVTAHDAMFLEGLGEIQKWVEGSKERNCNVIEFCKTYFKNGMTVIPMPKGVVKRLYTIPHHTWTRPKLFSQREWPEPEHWARRARGNHLPLHRGNVKLPLGFSYASADNDLKVIFDEIDPLNPSHQHFWFNHHHTGIWAIYAENIYIAPWIQSYESVVVEWAGIKNISEWTDNDLVSDAPDFRKALKAYVQFAHERDFGSDRDKREQLMGAWQEALADLMYQDREERRARESEPVVHHGLSYIDQILITKGLRTIQGLELPTAEDTRRQFIIGHVGNAGTLSGNADAVAAMVAGWRPCVILSTGGNTELATGAQVPYDTTIGRNYFSFIYPYVGNKGDGAERNKFWPAADAIDWTDTTLDLFKAFFPLPHNGRYYDFINGPIHFFVLDGNALDPDGNAINSAQAEWLKVRLVLSTAKWKIVVVGQPPHSSDSSAQTVALQWPFQAWGADIVLAGVSQSYERLAFDGLPYIVSGLGGQGIIGATASVSGSVVFYRGNYGAGKMTVTCDSLLYEFFAVDGTLIDSLQLTKSDD